MNTIIAYNSITGNTEICARWIRNRLRKAGHRTSLEDINDIYPSQFGFFDLIVIGVPTYCVKQMAVDFDLFLKVLQQTDLSGRQAAVFGLGDLKAYPDEFCTTADTLERILETCGASLIVQSLKVDGNPEENEALIKTWAKDICRLISC